MFQKSELFKMWGMTKYKEKLKARTILSTKDETTLLDRYEN